MPIQIEFATSLNEVESKLHQLEAKYQKTTAEVVDREFCVDIPGEDLIEWHFLYTQKQALEEHPSGDPQSLCFSPGFRSAVKTQEASYTYEEVAA